MSANRAKQARKQALRDQQAKDYRRIVTGDENGTLPSVIGVVGSAGAARGGRGAAQRGRGR